MKEMDFLTEYETENLANKFWSILFSYQHGNLLSVSAKATQIGSCTHSYKG